MLGYLGEFILVILLSGILPSTSLHLQWSTVSRFSFRSIMPPKRTVRSRNPSARAVQAAASSQPSRKRAKRPSGPSNTAGGLPVASEPSFTRHTSLVETQPSPAACGSPVAAQQSSAVNQVPFLPSGIMDQLVARVVDEVTKRLSSTDQIHHTSVAPTSTSEDISPAPGNLTGMPLVVPDAPPSSAALVPTAVSSSSNIISASVNSSQLPSLPLVSSSGLADTVVQGSVAATQSALSGELRVINPVLPAQLFSSPSLPIDARVSDKLRSKIWNNEFIEFGALLTNPIVENRYQVTISSSEKGSFPSLCLEPVNKSKKILSIETWLSCFHVFVGIYTSRFPHEAPALMKYGEVVQDLAFRGFNWHFYDENFRFLRQTQPASFPWNNIHWELWMRAQHSPFNKPQSLATSVQPKMHNHIPPKGYCFRFNRGVECAAGCNFKHQCFKCDGLHQASRCNFRAHRRPSTKQPQPSKPLPAKSKPTPT